MNGLNKLNISGKVCCSTGISLRHVFPVIYRQLPGQTRERIYDSGSQSLFEGSVSLHQHIVQAIYTLVSFGIIH